ncbi:MAG TPA: hypothetical protein VER96_32055 [Polyangiaceae bacterium]|nr:hypothetical protein [Polyangiaceae bacterium]
MRYPLSSASFGLFGAVLVTALAACGGSSSETPPPLQPDPAGFRYAPASSRPTLDESDAGNAPLDPNEKPRQPALAPSGSAPAAR